jgi:hypothetical protein
MVTEDNIAWAKDHLKSHSRKAVGMDQVHYDRILEIENDVLCRIIVRLSMSASSAMTCLRFVDDLDCSNTEEMEALVRSQKLPDSWP